MQFYGRNIPEYNNLYGNMLRYICNDIFRVTSRTRYFVHGMIFIDEIFRSCNAIEDDIFRYVI